ncbi:MAG TPA: 3'-5' exonuclease, partial [Methylophilaceae bacterium]|nr:3'-5' exonuclease [Methylophilaceae bacterium]
IPAFVALIKQMQEEASGLTLPEMAELATTLSGLKQHYLAEKEGEDRIANLDELINAAVAFINENDHTEESERRGLTEFLSFASLEAGEHQAEVGRDALQLMTVHAAKGLEFKAVFISGLEEGLCPHEQSLYEASGLEEERRLMYVAVTRARQRLYLSYAQSRMLHGQVRYGIPSRFLDEIPEALLKRLNARPIAAKQNTSRAGSGGIYRGTGSGNMVSASTDSRSMVSSQKSVEMPWKIGQSVGHSKFGNGVVVSYEGNADDLRVQVNFGKAGLKWLALEYAKLTPA